MNGQLLSIQEIKCTIQLLVDKQEVNTPFKHAQLFLLPVLILRIMLIGHAVIESAPNYRASTP